MNSNSYSINVLLQLAMMMNGNGPKELYNITSMLGLPSCRNLTKNYSGYVYDLYEKIIDAAKERVRLAIRQEIKLQYEKDGNNLPFSVWLRSPSGIRTIIGIHASFDMGWNKRASGKLYNSLSGHAF